MTRQERRWQRVRVAEWLLGTAFVAGFIALMRFGLDTPLFWVYIGLYVAFGAWMMWRQYSTLDEFGRGRWLRSHAAVAFTLATGLGTLLLWSIRQSPDGASPSLPLNLVLGVMIAGLLAGCATWHYLGWRDSRE